MDVYTHQPRWYQYRHRYRCCNPRRNPHENRHRNCRQQQPTPQPPQNTCCWTVRPPLFLVLILTYFPVLLTTTIMTMVVMSQNLSRFPVVLAAHSRSRRGRGGGASRINRVEDYDREITTFSPDGRLQQVEYAMEASRRGSTVLVAHIPSHDMIVICIESTSTKLSSSSSSSRSISFASDGKLHRLDDHIWMATSGLAGDGRYLANHAREFCQQHRQTNGEVPTIYQTSLDSIAYVHHFLTKTAGSRPLGCSSIVFGVNGNNSNNNDNGGGRQRRRNGQLTSVYQVDPGGGISEPTTMTKSFYTTFADSDGRASGDRLASQPRLGLYVIGRHQGDSRLISEMRSQIESTLSEVFNSENIDDIEESTTQKLADNNNENLNRPQQAKEDDEEAERLTTLRISMTITDCFLKQIDPQYSPSKNQSRQSRQQQNDKKGKNTNNENESVTFVDVWTIRPDFTEGKTRHRGGMKTTCYRGMNRHDTDSILRKLSSSNPSSIS